MSQSIISNEKRCLVCGTQENLHKHHIFYGSNRQRSEKDGCCVYLCAKHHNMSDHGIHFDHELDIQVKRLCQRIWETKFGDRQDFIKAYGRSWL